MAQHTPGPWSYDHSNGVIETEKRVVVAFGRYQRTDEETKSNGRLIAAAPELLAALRELTDWGREHTGPCDAHSPHDLLVAAVAAIEKAGDQI